MLEFFDFVLHIVAGIAIVVLVVYLARFQVVKTAMFWIRDRILWIHKRWEWYLVTLTVISLGVMINDVTTAKIFYLVGLMGFFVPPFCALPFVLVQLPILMIIGHAVSINAYKRLLGWVFYVAMAGLLIGIEPIQGDTVTEILKHRFNEEPLVFTVLTWLVFLAPPPLLFWWTVRERKNPQPHKWDMDARESTKVSGT